MTEAWGWTTCWNGYPPQENLKKRRKTGKDLTNKKTTTK